MGRKKLPDGELRKRKRLRHKNYYAETAHIYPERAWTKEECDLVLAHEITDRELSKKIERSMKSISVKRMRLKAKLREKGEINYGH